MTRSRSSRGVGLMALMASVELMALATLFYLSWLALTDTSAVVGCDAARGMDCDEVLSSRWSSWLHMPVALPALVVYATMLGATLTTGPWSPLAIRRGAWLLVMALTALAAAAAVWFILLQVVVLRAICVYCMLAHTCGLLLFAVALLMAPRRWPSTTGPPPAALLLGGHPAAAQGASAVSARRDHATRLPLGKAILAGVAMGGVFAVVQVLTVPKSYTITAEAVFAGVPTARDDGDGKPAVDAAAVAVWAPSAAAGAGPTADEPSAEAAPDRLGHVAPAAENTPAASASRPDPLADASGTSDAAPAVATLAILGGQVQLPLDQQLLLGSPAADCFVLTVFDYTCPHCRELLRRLRAAQARYGARLGIVLALVPLNAGCNPNVQQTYPQHEYACQYARLALAVWKHNRAAFAEYHQWLIESQDPPPPGLAGTRAEQLIRDGSLLTAVLDPWIEGRLREFVQLYVRYGSGTIPKLIMGGRVITGKVESDRELFDLIEESLSITPVASGQRLSSAR